MSRGQDRLASRPQGLAQVHRERSCQARASKDDIVHRATKGVAGLGHPQVESLDARPGLGVGAVVGASPDPLKSVHLTWTPFIGPQI